MRILFNRKSIEYSFELVRLFAVPFASHFLRMAPEENGQLLSLSGEYDRVRPVLSDAEPRVRNTQLVLPRVRGMSAFPS